VGSELTPEPQTDPPTTTKGETDEPAEDRVHDEWLVARKRLLAKEKDFTRARDRLNAERRRLPMVRIDKEYVFDGPDGKATLFDLFDGRRQLIVGNHRPRDPRTHR
jgi:predicted dithiol-disulfide oxidoreductase (DUF899 family)